MIVRLQLVNLISSGDERNEIIDKLILGSNTNVESFRFTEDDKNQVLCGVEHIEGLFTSKTKCEAIEYFSNESIAESDTNTEFFFHDVTEGIEKASQSEAELLPAEKSQTHKILYKLLANADQNVCRPKEGYRFDDETKEYASFIRTMSGPLLYNIIITQQFEARFTINCYHQQEYSRIE